MGLMDVFLKKPPSGGSPLSAVSAPARSSQPNKPAPGKLPMGGLPRPAPMPVSVSAVTFKDLPEIQTVLTHGERCLFSLDKMKLSDGSLANDAICAIDIGMNRVWLLQSDSKQQQLKELEALIKGRLVQANKTLVKVAICQDDVIRSVALDWASRSRSDLDVSRSPGLSYFKQWVNIAMAERAGDLHLSVRGARGLVQIRADTEIQPLPGPEGGVFPRNIVEAAIADSYGLLRASKSGQSTDFHKERGAYAMLPSEKLGLPVRIRYQFIANVHGGNAALRLLREGADAAVSSLEQAGYAPNGHIDEFTEGCRAMSASITLAGVTGSGKTTAQALFLRTLIDTSTHNVYEFGDPIEVLNDSVYQVSASRDVADANDKADFARFSAETMRGDPDVICIGETRDRESCGLFEKAALSGHLAMTTLHAKGLEGIPARFAQQDIGLSRDKMGSVALFGVLAYISLEPRLCNACKVPATSFLAAPPKDAEEKYCRDLTMAAKERCNLSPERLFYRRVGGCPECRNRGTKGVTNLAEVYRPTSAWRRLTRDSKDEDAFAIFREESDGELLSENFHGKPAFLHGLYKAASGTIDLRSLRAYGDILRYAHRERAHES